MSKRQFVIKDSKPNYAQWHVSLDISTWLNGDTIDNVNFTAKRKDTGADATNDVLDSIKSIFTDTIVKPYIKGGDNEVEYRVKMEVTTANGDQEVFWIDFSAIDD